MISWRSRIMQSSFLKKKIKKGGIIGCPSLKCVTDLNKRRTASFVAALAPTIRCSPIIGASYQQNSFGK